MSMNAVLTQLTSSPDQAWQTMQQSGITLLDLLEQPLQRSAHERGLRRIAELTAAQIYPNNHANCQQYQTELYNLISQSFQGGGQGSSSYTRSSSQTSSSHTPTPPPKSKGSILQNLRRQAQQNTSTNSNPFPNAPASQVLQRGASMVKGASKYLPAANGTASKLATRFLIVHPDYLKHQLFDDMAHHFGRVLAVVIASLFIGLIFSAFASYFLLAQGWFGLFDIAKHVFVYLGMVNAWNFYLYKHRGYRWR